MRTASLFLACLASAGHGREVLEETSSAAERVQAQPSSAFSPLRNLALTFFSVGKPASAFVSPVQPSRFATRVRLTKMQNLEEGEGDVFPDWGEEARGGLEQYSDEGNQGVSQDEGEAISKIDAQIDAQGKVYDDSDDFRDFAAEVKYAKAVEESAESYSVFPEDLTEEEVRKDLKQIMTERVEQMREETWDLRKDKLETPFPKGDDLRKVIDVIQDQDAAVSTMEDTLLASTKDLFLSKIEPVDPAAEQNIQSLVKQLEGLSADKQAHFDSNVLQVAMCGDWRLVYTDAKRIIEEGMTGCGSLPFCTSLAVLQRLKNSGNNDRLQTIEILEVTKGKYNSIALRGDWGVEKLKALSKFECYYEEVALAGGQNVPDEIADAAKTITRLEVTHVGTNVRIERVANLANFDANLVGGDIFVWERQKQKIETILEPFCEGQR